MTSGVLSSLAICETIFFTEYLFSYKFDCLATKFCFNYDSSNSAYLPVYRIEKLLLLETVEEVEFYNCNVTIIGEC